MDKWQELSAPIAHLIARLFLSLIFIFSGFMLPLVILLELVGGMAILIGFLMLMVDGTGAYAIDNRYK